MNKDIISYKDIRMKMLLCINNNIICKICILRSRESKLSSEEEFFAREISNDRSANYDYTGGRIFLEKLPEDGKLYYKNFIATRREAKGQPRCLSKWKEHV